MGKELEPFQKIANAVAKESDADTLAYIGGVNFHSARELVDVVASRSHRRTNLSFVLGTNGGDPHAAYKIARCLQHAYEKGKVTVCVYGECKSAGTLIAIAANDVVMCQHGELGPLDVQMKKDDQLFMRSSGLTTAQALESLKKEAFNQFEHFLLEIHDRTGYEISTRLATSMAIRMVTGLLGPIYQQIDPIRIGETQRAMNVAKAYGERLDVSRNLKKGALDRLIEGYPSHDFAIDFDEAKQLFTRLSRPSKPLESLGRELAHLLLNFSSIAQRPAIVAYLNEQSLPPDEEGAGHAEKTDDARKDKTAVQKRPEGGLSTKTPNGRGRKAKERGGAGGAGTGDEAAGNGAATASNGEHELR